MVTQTGRGFIPKEFIDELLNRSNLVEVIEKSGIKLRKAGNNYVANCPFHHERTPSFVVNSQKQFYYCFGCGASGNSIKFLMQIDRTSFVETVENLANQLGLEIPNQGKIKLNQDLTRYYDVLNKASAYYHQRLAKSPQALTYLKNRGLTTETIKSFMLGYAQNAWDDLLRITSADQHQSLTTMGMLVSKGDHHYDRFRDRIMFPIRDVQGRVVGFGGRSLNEEQNPPKYLNSPETVIFHKSNELYGLYEAKLIHKTLPYLLVVEGYLDVAALVQYGITRVVATLGTAITSKHVSKLLRYTSRLIFGFDGDVAGQKAAWRALENVLPMMRDDLEISFMFLPTGEDPDSQVRKEGRELFEHRIQQASPLSEFFFKNIVEGSNLSSIDSKSRLVSKAKPLLDRLPDGAFKQLMITKLENLTTLNLGYCSVPAPDPLPFQYDAISCEYKIPPLVEKSIAYLINEPLLASRVDLTTLAKLEITGIDLLLEVIEIFKSDPTISISTLIEQLTEPKKAQLLAKLATEECLIPHTHLTTEFEEIINRLFEFKRDQNINQLLEKTRNGKASKEDKYNLQKMLLGAKIKK